LRWHEQLALFDTAHIGTRTVLPPIDPAHFYELELDPQVSVMAEEEARLLAEETLTSVLGGHYAGRTPALSRAENSSRRKAAAQINRYALWSFGCTIILKLCPMRQVGFETRSQCSRQMNLLMQQWLLDAFAEWREDSLLLLKGWQRLCPATAYYHRERCAAALGAVQPGATRAGIAQSLEQSSPSAASAPVKGKSSGSTPGTIPGRSAISVIFGGHRCQNRIVGRGLGVGPRQMKRCWNWRASFGDAFSENKRETGNAGFSRPRAIRLATALGQHEPARQPPPPASGARNSSISLWTNTRTSTQRKIESSKRSAAKAAESQPFSLWAM